MNLGYVPEGVLNWLLLMGWGIAEGEFMGLEEMVQHFDINKVNPSPAAIDFAKLDYFSGAHIRQLTHNDLAQRVKPFFLKAGYQVDDGMLMQHHSHYPGAVDYTWMMHLHFAAFFFMDKIEPKAEDLVGKKLTPEESVEILKRSHKILSSLDEISHARAEPPMRDLVDEMGLKAGQVFGVLRVAVTGQKCQSAFI